MFFFFVNQVYPYGLLYKQQLVQSVIHFFPGAFIKRVNICGSYNYLKQLPGFFMDF